MKGQNMAHSPSCQAYSFSLSPPYYSPVHLQRWNNAAQAFRVEAFDRTVTWWHTKVLMRRIPLRIRTCVTARPRLQPFLWLILPPATTIKVPSAAGMLISPSLNWASTALPSLSDVLITFHFWHLSVQQLQQVRWFHCSPAKRPGNIIASSFPKRWPRFPGENRIFFEKQKNSSKGAHECWSLLRLRQLTFRPTFELPVKV